MVVNSTFSLRTVVLWCRSGCSSCESMTLSHSTTRVELCTVACKGGHTNACQSEHSHACGALL